LNTKNNWILIVLIILICSLLANIQQYIIISRVQSIPINLAQRYANEMLGYINGLEEELDLAKQSNWSDANQLWSISSNTWSACMKAVSVLDFTPSIEKTINKNGNVIISLADLWPDFRNESINFRKAAVDHSNGLTVDTQKLERFRAKIKKANFPNQTTFTWQRLYLSINRYFAEDSVNISGDIPQK
jgi:hypothetical protein